MRVNLQNARREIGMTQVQVAKAIGISIRVYQYYEAGGIAGSVRVWDALEALFGIPQQTLRKKGA